MGNTLVLAHESSGLQHYLLDREVRAGTSLQMFYEGDWIAGRYEWSFNERSNPYLVIGEDRSIPITSESELRWPTS